MQTGAQRDGHQLMPGRMELDLVEAVAVAVERAQNRRIVLASKPSLTVSGLPSVAPSASARRRPGPPARA